MTKPQNPPPPSPDPLPPEPGDDLRAELLKLHNIARARNGLPALVRDARLDKAAQKYAVVMAERMLLSHTIGGTFTERLRKEGYRYSSAGENIAAGQQTPTAAVNAWMNSPGHRQNLLGSYSHVGLGVAADARGVQYWCADFGSELGASEVRGALAPEPLTPGPCDGRA
jgi:uncharacterized protein YkwD